MKRSSLFPKETLLTTVRQMSIFGIKYYNIIKHWSQIVLISSIPKPLPLATPEKLSITIN